MSEKNEQQPSNPIPLKAYGAVAAIPTVTAGAALGGYVANELFPPTVELAPGISAEASIATGHGLIIPVGPLAEVNLPAVPADPPGPWDAIKLDVNNVGNIKIPDHTPDWLSTYVVGIFNQPRSDLVEPVKHALIERLLLGAGIGAATAAAVGGAALAYLHLRRQNATLRAENKALKESAEPVMNTEGIAPSEKLRRKRWPHLRKPLAALALAGAFLGGCSTVYETVGAHDLPIPKNATLLPDKITSLDPLLKNANIKGPLKGVPQTAVDSIIEIKKNVDNSLETSAINFSEAYHSFASTNDQYAALRANPNVKSLLHGTDFHCNLAYASKVFGVVVNAIQPDIFLNTGDTQTNSGTAELLENNCYPALLDNLGDVPIVSVNGNHDAEANHEGTITLNKDNDYHATIQDIEFVGDTDPERTKWTATPEEDKGKLQEKIIDQGNHIADAACKIYEDTGVKPIALAHRWQSLSKAVLSGCIILGDNGHLHTEMGLKAYKAEDGSIVFQHTGGSMSGVDANIPVYDDFAQNGYLMEQLYDTTTNAFVGFVTYTFDTDGSVNITFEEAPETVEYPSAMADYLEENNEQLSQAEIPSSSHKKSSG